MSFNCQGLCQLRVYTKKLLWSSVVLEIWKMRCVKCNLLINQTFLSPTLFVACIYIDLLLMLVQVVSFFLLNMYLHLAWCLHSIVNSETVTEASLSSLLSKRNTFFEQLDYFLNNFFEVEEMSKHGNQLACRVSIVALIYQISTSTNLKYFYSFFFFFPECPNFDLMRSILCPRFVQYLPKHGFCSERRIILQQSWKD